MVNWNQILSFDKHGGGAVPSEVEKNNVQLFLPHQLRSFELHPDFCLLHLPYRDKSNPLDTHLRC